MLRHLSYYLAMIDNEDDRRKFEILYNKFHRLMYNKAMSIVKRQHLAEDALQDAFTYIAQHMERIDDPASDQTLGLLTTVTKHKALDYLRKESVRDKRHADFEELEDMPVPDFTEFVGNDAVAIALQSLPEKYRTVLILRYVHGLEAKEIAPLLEYTVSNTHKMIDRAKKKLADALAKGAEQK